MLDDLCPGQRLMQKEVVDKFCDVGEGEDGEQSEEAAEEEGDAQIDGCDQYESYAGVAGVSCGQSFRGQLHHVVAYSDVYSQKSDEDERDDILLEQKRHFHLDLGSLPQLYSQPVG